MKIGRIELQEMDTVNSAMCLISPAQAKLLLERNIRNRPASNMAVAKYAFEMARDEWLPTGTGISFDEKGVLLDGQQRLMAVVDSKKTVPLLVTTHLPERSQEKIDRHRRRTMFDIFSMFEAVNCREAVQIATFLAKWAKADGTKSWSSLADSEVRDSLRIHNDALEIIAPLARKKIVGITRAPVMAAIVLVWEKYGNEAQEFFDAVKSEVHSSRLDPCLRLRAHLTSPRNGNTGGFDGAVDIFERTIYAFNAYHAKRQICAVYRSSEVE